MNLFLSIAVSILILLDFASWNVSASTGMTDTASGISFPFHQKNGLEIFGVGIRKKGPIKIYSVACYGNKTLKETLKSTIHRSKMSEKDVNNAFQRSIVQQSTGSTTSFVIQMVMKVGAAKMASAIADSVSSRHINGNPKDVEQLKDFIVQGAYKNGNGAAAAIKGTIFQFDCHSNTGMDIMINNQHIGTISSPTISNAFCNVYCDNECVSPTLRKSCIEHCCSE